MIKVPIFFSLNKLGITGAQKELKKLTSQTKAFGLTSKLSIGAASVALTAYTKKAITAAIADEKAQKALAQTLKNLGLQFQTVGVTKFIDNLQRATGVSEDALRPAFQKLVLVLGDVGKAQSALELAMSVSAGTGKDLTAVSMALAKGYSGQTTALSRLGAGLDKTLLASGDMEAITAKLSELFAGQAQTAAKTYAGQMGILRISAAEATETIGTSLIEALIRLGDNKGIDSAARSMENFAAQIGFVITGFSIMADKISANPIFKALDLFILTPLRSPFTLAANLGRGAAAKNITQTNRQSPRATERAALAADKLNKAKKITLDLNNKISASEKLKAMFDIDGIQLEAALKGKISDLDRANLLGMQALKTKDQNDDISALKNFEQAKISADAADRSRKIAALQDTINFNKLALADIESTIAKMAKLPVPIYGNIGGITPASPNVPAGQAPNYPAPITPMMPSTNTGTAPAAMGDPFAAARAALPSVNFNPPAVAVTVNANTIADPDQLTRLIQAGIQAVARNGWSSSGTATG